MLAVLYLILCAAFGICFVGLCVPDVRRLYVACSPSAKAITHIPNTLFTVPAGIVTGLMCVPFFNYFVILGLSYVMNSGGLCMKLGILITFAFFIWMILTCLILINRMLSLSSLSWQHSLCSTHTGLTALRSSTVLQHSQTSRPTQLWSLHSARALTSLPSTCISPETESSIISSSISSAACSSIWDSRSTMQLTSLQ